MTNNYILTTYNTPNGNIFALMDGEGKLTEPRFIPWTPGFASYEEAAKPNKAVSKTRSRIKQRLIKQLGSCSVIKSEIVDTTDTDIFGYEFVDASRRFGTVADVEAMLASQAVESVEPATDDVEYVDGNWEVVSSAYSELKSKLDARLADDTTLRKTGYILHVYSVDYTNPDADSEINFYVGRYNAAANNIRDLSGHTWGYADPKYFTGKVMDMVRDWKSALEGTGSHELRFIVLRVDYDLDGQYHANIECEVE